MNLAKELLNCFSRLGRSQNGLRPIEGAHTNYLLVFLMNFFKTGRVSLTRPTIIDRIA